MVKTACTAMQPRHYTALYTPPLLTLILVGYQGLYRLRNVMPMQRKTDWNYLPRVEAVALRSLID